MIETTSKYTSLEAIVERKQQLKTEIAENEKQIKTMWRSLFHEEKPVLKTTSQRLTKILSIGTGVVDGALLGWKLYRKFKR